MGNSLNCWDECKAKREHRMRVQMLQQGGEFKKKKYTFGIPSGSDQVKFQLSPDEQSLLWENAAGSNDIPLQNVRSIKAQSSLGIGIVAKDGTTLLELEAESEPLRNQWVTNLQLLLEGAKSTGQSNDADASFRKTVEEKARSQAYWMKRTQELNDRKKEAEERKKKYAGAGLKYTAIAMSQRGGAKDDTKQDDKHSV